MGLLSGLPVGKLISDDCSLSVPGPFLHPRDGWEPVLRGALGCRLRWQLVLITQSCTALGLERECFGKFASSSWSQVCMFSEQTVVWGFDEVVVAIIELLFYRNHDSTLRKKNYFSSFSDLPLITHPHFPGDSPLLWFVQSGVLRPDGGPRLHASLGPAPFPSPHTQALAGVYFKLLKQMDLTWYSMCEILVQMAHSTAEEHFMGFGLTARILLEQ